MKSYSFAWNDDIYLIHVQFDTPMLEGLMDKNIIVKRLFDDGTSENEYRLITNNGFRFIISRSCPEETGVEIEYDKQVTMKLYIIDDRAYYPTSTYYEG